MCPKVFVMVSLGCGREEHSDRKAHLWLCCEDGCLPSGGNSARLTGMCYNAQLSVGLWDLNSDPVLALHPLSHLLAHNYFL